MKTFGSVFMLLLSWCAFSAASKLPAQELKELSYEVRPNNKEISPEIVNDLLEIADLIPKAAIDVVVAEHMLWDEGFRKALQFLKSSKFNAFADQLLNESIILELLDFLHVLVPKSEENDQDLSVPFLEIVLLEAATADALQREARQQQLAVDLDAFAMPALEVSASKSNQNENDENLRSFTGAVREVLNYLPHDKFRNLISDKCQQSKMFSDFYKALRSAQFRTKAEAAMASKDLSPYISTLSAHAIDAKTLKEIAFNVITWGPDVSEKTTGM